MKHFEDFKRTGDSFEERTGVPDAFSAAIGRINLNFSDLEDRVALEIGKLFKIDESLAQIITCELSFKNKLHILSSLVRHFLRTRKFNTGHGDPLEVLSELIGLCFKAEELRNQIFHSSWSGAYLRDEKAKRRKVTAKARRGLNIHHEEIDSGYLLDIADFIICVSVDVEEFFYDVGPESDA